MSPLQLASHANSEELHLEFEFRRLNKILIESNNSRSVFAEIFFQEYLNEKKKKRWADKTPGNTFFCRRVIKILSECEIYSYFQRS